VTVNDNDKFENVWKGEIMVYVEVLYLHWPGRNEKEHGKAKDSLPPGRDS
jgi:hypothetical protein